MTQWNALARPWQAAFEAATRAYLQGSIPIGAVVMSQGEIISLGSNQFAQNRLAHAELAALSNIPGNLDRRRCEIYCTLEPCPMCVGAIRLCQLPALHYGADDPAAGAAALFGASEFMRRYPCSVSRLDDRDFEFVVVALVLEYRCRNGHERWRDQWSRRYPCASRCAESLAKSDAFRAWTASRVAPADLYDRMAALQSAA